LANDYYIVIVIPFLAVPMVRKYVTRMRINYLNKPDTLYIIWNYNSV